MASEQNAEVVRRWLALGWTSAAEVSADVEQFFDSDADYYPVRKFPEARPCHGTGEIARFFTEFMAAWSEYVIGIRRLIEVGDDRVLVCGRLRAEGRETGVALEDDLYVCYWLRQRRIFRQEDHLTLGGALRALGLEGETLEAAGLA